MLVFLPCTLLLAVSEQELVWANGEENPNFFTMFGKFAELQWIYNDAAKCMANKVSIEYNMQIPVRHVTIM
jgi:hypothetical protein